jgi:hypothetical protein
MDGVNQCVRRSGMAGRALSAITEPRHRPGGPRMSGNGRAGQLKNVAGGPKQQDGCQAANRNVAQAGPMSHQNVPDWHVILG